MPDSNRLTPARCALAVAFGLTGFAVNCIDIQLFPHPFFKVNILAGLVFPLLVSLAWGWRLGLVSALAGGCQSMWWLWRGDGWGVIYSVPVFTAWVVWHGYWAEVRRRQQSPAWHLSAFAVEAPFRLLCTLGFYTLFRWLVSLNPPFWNPAIQGNRVSLAWLNLVTAKHAVSAYLLLTLAHALLSLGWVRRRLRLPPLPAQEAINAIYCVAVLFAAGLWTVDALLQALLFNPAGRSFWDLAVLRASAHVLCARILWLTVCLLAGAAAARFARERGLLIARLDHLNRVLGAIRNVNQLITQEKNPTRLLPRACQALVQTGAFHGACIVRVEPCAKNPLWRAPDGARPHPYRVLQPIHHAGDARSCASMAAGLEQNRIPECALRALQSEGVVMVQLPPRSRNTGATRPETAAVSGEGEDVALLARLCSRETIFGWVAVILSGVHAGRAEEQELLTEVAGDLAFALRALAVEREQEALAAQLLQSEKMRVLGQIAGGVAHDFNNQLAGVLGCADLLRRRLRDARALRWVDMIARSAGRAANLTRQLLAFSRKGRNVEERVDLRVLLDDVAEILERTIDKRIRIERRYGPHAAVTVGDPDQLHHAFMNIAINARDAMPAGGELVFALEQVSLDQDYCREHPYPITPGRFVQVSVTDSGCGMDAATRERIFEPFFTTKPQGQGTGMGLAGVWGAVQAHGGSISVYSEPGRGTTFKVCLPLAADAAGKPAPETDAEDPLRPLAPARILLVDDEEALRETARAMLVDLGCEVVACADGPEALRVFRDSAGEFDLVMLDLTMPLMSGRELFDALRRFDPTARVIVISGHGINGAVSDLLARGAHGYLGKPFKQTDLAAAVRRTLQSPRETRRAPGNETGDYAI